MSHACHRFWKCNKTLTFCSLLTRFTIPCACHAKAHLHVQKCSVPQKFFTLLTSKCASRHNGVHFFDIATSKSGFVHFDFEMCFAPQWRAFFRRLNFQKWSEPGVFCTFWLRNVLRATTACTFSTSQLQKVPRTWGVFSFFICKCASRHNGVQFCISHLASWLRTRCFSEPTFRPSGATLETHSVSRLFYLFAHLDLLSSGSSFFWDFLFFEALSFLIFFLLSSSLLFSSLRWLLPPLLFICQYCRKFDF